MKQYKSNLNVKVEAVQFTQENRVELYKEIKDIRLCTYNPQSLYSKTPEIYANPRDLMGTPKDSFWGIKTGDTWHRLEEGSWIIKKEENYLTIPNGVFQLLFTDN